MTFAHPSLLIVALIAIPVLALGFAWSWRTRKRLITLFVPKRLQESLTLGISPRRATARATLLILGITLLLFALARPRFGAGMVEVNQRGLDILIGIDTSRSMLAEDVGPNISRLQRAKLAALDLAKLAKTDRVGLVAFAGGAFLQCPLTIDFEAFRQSVEALDTGVIQQGGTAIGPAIHTALEAFSEERQNVRVLVLFTDGEEHEAGALDAAKRAESKGLRIYTVGVGSPKGEIIRLRDAQGATTYLKDSQGNAVKSSLNESLLRQVATQTGGLYLPLQGPRAMSELYTRALEPLPRSDIEARLMEQFLERFQFPLALAILFLGWEALFPERARVGNRLRASRHAHPTLSSPSPTSSLATLVALGTLALLTFAPASALASPGSALRRYREADYPAAQAEFERLAKEKPADPRLRFNAGAAAYRAGDLDSAAKHFQDSLASTDLRLQSDAFYNLGNTQFQIGEKGADPTARQQAWEQSLKCFEAAVQLAPTHTNAQHNLEFVRQRLEDLKQQQDPQQQQSQGDKKDENKDEQKNQNQSDSSKQDPKDKSKDQSQPQDGQSKDQQKPQDQDQDSQDPQESPDSDNQPSQDPGEQKDQASKSSQEGKPDAEKPGEKTAQNADSSQAGEPTPPGDMSPQQAFRLLDAAKGEEKLMPLEKKRSRPRSLKDW